MTQPEGGVTAAEIYTQLAKLSAKIDVLITKMDGASAQGADHEARIRALEKNRWPMQAVAVLASIAAVVVAILAAVNGK